ncbi:MAG TPA: hypothetical protein DGH68_02955 [Bacteroidetes bacterium]|nr:hypothetical protein [Bacteroidota bacterium]
MQVLGVLAIVALVAAYPTFRFASAEIVVAMSIGALLSTVNVLLGFLAIEFSFDKSYTTFLKIVLGGMGVRMALLLAVLLVLIKVVELHAVALTVSLLSFYLIFLVLEVLFIQKKAAVKNQN